MNELAMLSEFLNALPDKAIDFYPVSKTFSRPYLENIIKAELEIFGRTQSDCLIGSWKKKFSNTSGQEMELIVWIDSEGSPNAVIADGIIEFISLLYFDTGFIYDTLSAIKRRGKPNLQSITELEELEKSVQQNYLYGNQFQEFIFKELMISKPPHPELIIYDAHKKNDDFEEWFQNKQ